MSSAWSRAGCLAALVLSLAFVPTAGAATPRLDPGFGEGGVARVPFGHATEFLYFGLLRPVRQPDGKVLLAARIEEDGHGFPQVALARFTRTGQPDLTFGRGGRVRLRSGLNFYPLTVLAQPDASILLVGTVGGYASSYTRPTQLGIVRLLADGSRDRAFGTNGFVAWNPPWRTTNEWTTPGLALRQSDGRLLVAASVADPTLRGSPQSWQRVVLARFQPDGSLDPSFGQGGFAEQNWDDGYFRDWVRLADGRIASLVTRHEGPGEPTDETTAWWFHSFTTDGSAAGELRSAGSVRLGLDVFGELVDLLPARDGSLVVIGNDHLNSLALPIRRIRPDGQLDPSFGTACPRSVPRVSLGGGAAAISDGRVYVTATESDNGPRPPDSFFIRYDTRGCVSGRPLRVKALAVGPPLLQGRRTAIVGATYYKTRRDPEKARGLALIRIRR
jgi:uncharacterized delta-60 repeat protein